MERGLLWLPLLITFIWLARAGWNEYQKVEKYRIWAEDFDNAKYDIYAVLGKKGKDLTWGKPTRKGLIEINTFSLTDVDKITLIVGDRPADWDNPPNKGKTALEFSFSDQAKKLQVPFTDIDLAAQWGKYLQKEWQELQTT